MGERSGRSRRQAGNRPPSHRTPLDNRSMSHEIAVVAGSLAPCDMLSQLQSAEIIKTGRTATNIEESLK